MKSSLILVRLGIALATISLLGDLVGWDTCGGNVCASGLWARYRHFFGALPVSGVALLTLFLVQSLWQLFGADPVKHAAYFALGRDLLALASGGALFHVYLQAAVIGDFCPLCLSLALTMGLALTLALLHSPYATPSTRGALCVMLGFLTVNFVHHHGPALPAMDFERAAAEALVQAGADDEETDVSAAGSAASTAELRERLTRARTIGRDDAPVTLEVFSDLACPHCARFEAEVLPGLMQEFVRTGQLRIILRSFYAPGHEQARIADILAQAIALLAPQETHLTARRRLFEATQAGAGDLKTAIAELVDMPTLARTINRHGDLLEASIQTDLDRAQELAISAPPSFAIIAPSHQNIFMGMQRPAVFQAAIRHALQQP